MAYLDSRQFQDNGEPVAVKSEQNRVDAGATEEDTVEMLAVYAADDAVTECEKTQSALQASWRWIYHKITCRQSARYFSAVLNRLSKVATAFTTLPSANCC